MIGTRLRGLRSSRGWTQAQMAQELNKAETTARMWELDDRTPDDETILKICEVFNTTTDYLFGLADAPNASTRAIPPIPILGTIRAGIPILAHDNFEGELDLGKEFKADFALHVQGNSMSWAGIHSGDIALLRHTEVAQNGDIVAAGKADGDWTATLKYYINNNGSPLLRAANPDYPDIVMDDRFRIIGVVVHIIKGAPGLGEYQHMVGLKSRHEEGWDRVVETASAYGMDADSLHSLIIGMRAMMGGKK